MANAYKARGQSGEKKTCMLSYDPIPGREQKNCSTYLRSTKLKSILSSAPSKGYSLVRTADGGFSVSVFEDKAGTDESMKVAREWIKKNAASTGASPATVTEGSVITHLK
jgi:hypothetical protein